MVTAPDFFPGVDQREVFQWWTSLRSQETISNLEPWMQNLVRSQEWADFWEREPLPLSNFRAAPNVKIENADFDSRDRTISSIVTILQNIDLDKKVVESPSSLRHAALPDAAAGFFAPGWDTSVDETDHQSPRQHLATYGLGAPFPEDAKLCAALSTFWPAVAPDTARTFLEYGGRNGTVCPMTDDEVGATPNGIAWDGVQGPTVQSEDADITITHYTKEEYADYTINALDGKFSIALTHKITLRDYKARIISMRRCYIALRILGDASHFNIPQLGNKGNLHVLSYQQPSFSDANVIAAHQALAPQQLTGPLHKYDIYPDQLTGQRITRVTDVAGDFYNS